MLAVHFDLDLTRLIVDPAWPADLLGLVGSRHAAHLRRSARLTNSPTVNCGVSQLSFNIFAKVDERVRGGGGDLGAIIFGCGCGGGGIRWSVREVDESPKPASGRTAATGNHDSCSSNTAILIDRLDPIRALRR